VLFTSVLIPISIFVAACCHVCARANG